MATTLNPLPLSHPFPSTLPPHSKPTTTLQATDPNAASEPSTASDPSFDTRLSKLRLKYRSGTGKKAELRRAKKAGNASKGNKNKSLMLPPIQLKEPTSAGGLKVALGFTPYSERLNGAVAGLGLAALVLVELASGKGLFEYHAGPTILIQVYTVAALAAVFVKFEKERISVWPEKLPETEVAAGDGSEGEL